MRGELPIFSLHIREANQDEFGLIRTLRVAAYEEYSTFMPEEAWLGLRSALQSTVDEGTGVEILVAQWNDSIVGSVVMFPANVDAYAGQVDEVQWPEIRMLAVSPEVRRSGVGRQLVEACIGRARQRGAAYVGLHTADQMQGATRLYLNMGFERVPEVDFHPTADVIVKGYRLKL